MIKVSVMYPNEEGKTFNMDYYLNSHLPMVKTAGGSLLTSVTIDQGLAGGIPGSKAPYLVTANMHFNSLEDFMGSVAPHTQALITDIPNFTDITPVLQISEVLE